VVGSTWTKEPAGAYKSAILDLFKTGLLLNGFAVTGLDGVARFIVTDDTDLLYALDNRHVREAVSLSREDLTGHAGYVTEVPCR
jgi:hypothetical protein